MSELGQALVDLFTGLWHVLVLLGETLGRFLTQLTQAVPVWPLLVVWVAWWLLAVNWQKAWPVLARGGWAPVALLIFMAALVWSRLAPADLAWVPGAAVPNFWWQLVATALLAASALFCGWLQGVFGWRPPEFDLEPPAAPAHAHDHGHP